MIAGFSAWVKLHRRRITPAMIVAMAVAGFSALYLILRGVHPHDVRQALATTSSWRLWAAVGLTGVSYLALTCNDVIGLAVVGRPQPWRFAAATSFMSYAISNNLGLPLITGGSARYRAYAAVGLSLPEVAWIGMMASAAFWVAVGSTAAAALLAASGSVHLGPYVLSDRFARISGTGCLLLLAAIPVARRFGSARLRLAGFAVPLPTVRQMLLLSIAAQIDFAASAAVLAILVPELGIHDLPAFVLAYGLAIGAGVIAHVPGGVGVFEAVLLAMIPHDRPALLAALLLYRLVYYLVPLLLAGGLVVGIEGTRLRRPMSASLSLLDRAARTLTPTIVTLLVFMGGVILLVSGALPGAEERLLSLAALPLPVVEGSHLAGSLAGVALLLVAPALSARLASGFHAARLLLLGGALFSILKGLDYEEASILLLVAGLLQYSRRSFYRQGGVLSEPLDRVWLGAGAAALVVSAWAGFVAYKHTPYSADLWWQFALTGDAPRFLRATFGAGVLMTAAIAWRLLLRRGAPGASPILSDDVAARAIAASPRSDDNLAFTGDKRFLVSAAEDAFLMYGVHGRTWIVMGDPIGPRERWDELVWAARSASDAVGGRLCFYQASEAMLPFFVDLGLRTYKYGEEAQIPLADFTLAGGRSKALRHGRRRAVSAGLTFSIIPSEAVRPILPDLRLVSDEWLHQRGTHEKSFSLGSFDPDYLARFDIAAVHDGDSIVAFANIWTSGDGRELSVDLMRHRSAVPYGTMDLLFVELLAWGRSAGFERFNLGVAPLSGIRSERLAPAWAKFARALFENGERFYSFAGLRAFKNKFDPHWTPRYIATAPGVGAVAAAIDLVAAVSSRRRSVPRHSPAASLDL